jgi:hypothetical protein
VIPSRASVSDKVPDLLDPQDFTKFEWEVVILLYLGATPEEIKDVQTRMGRMGR